MDRDGISALYRCNLLLFTKIVVVISGRSLMCPALENIKLVNYEETVMALGFGGSGKR